MKMAVVLLMVLVAVVSSTEVGNKRADDLQPLELVVQQLSAKVQTQDAELQQLKGYNLQFVVEWNKCAFMCPRNLKMFIMYNPFLKGNSISLMKQGFDVFHFISDDSGVRITTRQLAKCE
jgi:hypothetical protein